MESKTRTITGLLLGVFALVLLVWDVVVAHNATTGDTISEILRDLSHSYYSLPLLLGIVMGHLFWNEDPEDRAPLEERRKTFWTKVAGPSSLVIARDLANLGVDLPELENANLVMVVAGFFLGARYWPQAKVEAQEEDTSA